ncbi:MAG: PD-(D/E)XK nuclease family protein [Rhodocyclaceae bacterium]|nr:PD-(D/E)XK nuclease family protein [Rhodocyclaceae bacterium]
MNALPPIILCATHRLARHLRTRGRSMAMTLAQWLDTLGEATDPAPLSGIQERLLWESAVAADDEDALFDREGLAAMAAEADALCEVWGLRPDSRGGEEAARFLRWRAAVRRECQKKGWLSASRWRSWKIARLSEGEVVPSKVILAGFDRFSPQEKELIRVLEARGTVVEQHALMLKSSGTIRVMGWPDVRAECKAAAEWAKQKLAQNASVRLGLIVPDLGGRRNPLKEALDEALHPEAWDSACDDFPRRYSFSLGLPLARFPIIATALSLLRVNLAPHRCDQSALSTLLLGPYWSAFETEADGRAQLEAAMRRNLPPVVRLTRVLALRHRFNKAPQTLAHLEKVCVKSKKVDGWATHIAAWLSEVGWPGERALSRHEQQAVEAFTQTLGSIEALEPQVPLLDQAGAVRLLARLCREELFQPEMEERPSVEVIGPLEAAGLSFDAIWVMGLSESAWPPPARPNALLSAQAQRQVGSPHAGAQGQTEFARSILKRLQHSAPEGVFSWVTEERMSPLLAGLPVSEAGEEPKFSRFAQCMGQGTIDYVDDHQAPPVGHDEKIKGGAALIKAQSLCPAWAFYRYRLGARALEEPVEGLDAMGRGVLLHHVMEKFWKERTQMMLWEMSGADRAEAVRRAVVLALEEFNAQREAPLSPRFLALEQTRLEGLLSQWLLLELERPVLFSVQACESPVDVTIEGLTLRVKMDRVDVLSDGRQFLIDYKTGNVSAKDWQGERLAEPQLPIYAAYATSNLAGVAFAKVKTDECAFVGLGCEANLIEGLKVADDWPAQIEQWRAAIAALVREIREGYAPVIFADASDLRYCEVLPLLRIDESRGQLSIGAVR